MDSIGLTVDGDELTVWASAHHVHIGIGEITDEDISNAFGLLDEIIADKTLVVSVWKGDRLRLSSFEDANKPSHWHSEQPGDHRLVVHSWTGQGDAERAISWPGWIRSIRRAFTG